MKPNHSGDSTSYSHCPECGQEYMPVLVCACPAERVSPTRREQMWEDVTWATSLLSGEGIAWERIT